MDEYPHPLPSELSRLLVCHNAVVLKNAWQVVTRVHLVVPAKTAWGFYPILGVVGDEREPQGWGVPLDW